MSRIASVVVTYNPEESVSFNLRRLSDQSRKVFLIDNNSNDKKFLESLPSNCEILSCTSNIGLASALNFGILKALAEGYEAIATFDQDTCIPEHYFERMLEGVEFTEKSSIGILSPLYKDRVTGVKKAFASRAMNKDLRISRFNLTRSTMTSGSIINPYAIKNCGLFLEEMFIDQLDNELCLRYRRNGYLILESEDVIIEHSVGNNTEKYVMGLKMTPSNHSSIRRYYIARNRLYVYKKYFMFDIRWLLLDLRGFVRESIKILLFEENKSEKIAMTLEGLKHGLTGKMGPFRGLNNGK